MWSVVPHITTGIALAAFLAAIAAWAYRASLKRKERLIRTAPESERAVLVESSLEFFRVDTSGLTKAQMYDIALQQIHARERRFFLVAGVVSFVAVLLTGLSAYTIYRSPNPNASDRSGSPVINDSSLEIVDLGLLPDRDKPSLDIKLRNRGAVSAYLKKLKLEVLDHVSLRDCYDHQPVPPSSEYFYDIIKDTDKPISNVVPAGGVERIVLVIADSWYGEPQDLDFYLLRLVLISDADNKTLTSEPFPVRLPQNPSWVVDDPYCINRQMDKVRKVYAWKPAYSLPSIRLGDVRGSSFTEIGPDGSWIVVQPKEIQPSLR